MAKYKIIIILACAIVIIAAISGKVFTSKTVSNKTTKSILIKPSNLDDKNVQTANTNNNNINSIENTHTQHQQSSSGTDSNNSNSSSNSNSKELMVSEKMVTQNGDVIIPAKVVYKGDNYNPQNIENMQLPNGYQFVRLNVYNNGNMVETGGTQTTNLENFDMDLPTINNLASGNLSIEYIVEKISNTSSNSNADGNLDNNISKNDIKLVNYTNSQMINPNDVIVENGTGEPISNTELMSVIKNWILVQQYNYRGFADCNGTMWSKQWLDNIPNSKLIDYFIKANGNAALSKNITAEELSKTAKNSLVYAQEHPNPFSQEQTKEYITQMLKESYPNQTITKIVFHGSKTNGGDYYVYTKEFGDKEPFWYVESWIGYATGV